MHCAECGKLFDRTVIITDSLRSKQFCSNHCRDSWTKKHLVIPKLAVFCEKRIEPWANRLRSRLWFRSGIRPLLKYDPIAAMQLDNITSESVADYAAHRQSLGLEVGTINRELRVLRRVLRLAVEWGLLDRTPRIQMLPGEKRRERVVSEEELLRYLGCASPLLAAVAIMLNDTGLRPDECHRLRWEDITWINGRNGSLLVTEGKTAAARRVLPMSPKVRAVLEARWNAAGTPLQGWIWPAPTKSGHIDHSTLKKQHTHALNLSGVRLFLLYSLRHSFATRIAPHVDAWTLCKIMGWTSLSVAMRYIHPSDDRVLEAISGLGGHNSGHTEDLKKLSAFAETRQITEKIAS
ncbi:MAG TPA: tyrosine-type recombinase/integrase [Terriglobales bacterium]|nr:tyrosine-type recombinase/integrase [Terriglobales bacterium]